jgi:hypothetical protein
MIASSIQEGMVFVSMEYDDLFSRTARYQIQYAAPRSQKRRESQNPNHEPIRSSIRYNADGTSTVANVNMGLHDSDSEEYDDRIAQLPSDFTHQSAPPFRVITECCDSDSDSVCPAPRRRRATDRRSDGINAFSSAFLAGLAESTDSSDSDPDEMAVLLGAELQAQINREEARAQPREPRPAAPRISTALAEAVSAAQEATREAVKAVGGTPIVGSSAEGQGLMPPLAMFFIERDKSKCVIKFDPPVSGRFILLKMWNPHHSVHENIDIQSVVAKGFAGPRLFPAAKLR